MRFVKELTNYINMSLTDLTLLRWQPDHRSTPLWESHINGQVCSCTKLQAFGANCDVLLVFSCVISVLKNLEVESFSIWGVFFYLFIYWYCLLINVDYVRSLYLDVFHFLFWFGQNFIHPWSEEKNFSSWSLLTNYTIFHPLGRIWLCWE